MEKLIELLNEFETPRSGIVFKSYDDYDGTFYGVDCDGETEIAWSDSFICGKRFQWVKWSVDNDKIDTESYCRITSVERKLEKDVYRDEVDSLLMLLAIQDEPIRFLCEILK